MQTKGREDGQVLVFLALSMVVLLAIAGLAIDGGIAYGVKAKLSSAMDAAALAAANATGDSSGGYAAAIAAGTARFKSNYPAGYLNSTPSAPTINVSPNTPGPGQIQVTVSASATAPTFFMQIVGLNRVNASSTAQAVKKDLDMVFVIDTTSSLIRSGNDNPALKAAAVSFINRFNATSDRVGLVLFAEGAIIKDPISTSTRGFNKTQIVNDINNMTFNGHTNFTEAFWDARAQLDSIPASSRSSCRVIVFFSDGSPNSFSSTFVWKPSIQKTGVICTVDGTPGDPFGLYKTGVLDTTLSGYIQNPIYSYVTTLPAYFNLGSGVGDGLYHVLGPPSGTGMAARPVNATYVNDNNKGFEDVNNAARNLPEEMANNARASGIYVYTLGLNGPDALLTSQKSWGNHETGDAILKNMANDPSAPNHGADQPTGIYAFAADDSELQQAFDEIASQLLRLTQ